MNRTMSITGLQSRTMGGLKGFGFTVTFTEPGNGQIGEMPVMAPRQAGEASSDASPVAANHNFTRIPVLGEVR